MHTAAFADPALTFALALAAGVVAIAISHHLRVPGIVIFLLAGVLLGPDVAGVVRPQTLGHGLEMLVGLAVAVILFEGGLNLNIDRLRREAKTIRRLVTGGALVTAAGGALLAHQIMGWEWRVAILFGTLVIVTGPTVITPLLRRIRVNKSLQTVLEAEGVLIDPVGAIIAVVALEIIVTGSASEAAGMLLGIPSRLIVGAILGAIGGLLIAGVLHYEQLIPDEIENIFTLALVLAVFEVSNALLAESGIMAAAIAGMVVGNLSRHVTRELKEFKEQITVMLVALLFVLLAADVRLADVVALGWPGLFTILGLMFLVRPLDVALCTAGSTSSRSERLFMSWLSPRGIVAAAVASLFATRLTEEGIPGGTELRALVFLVIAVTVVLQGLTGGFVASWLGVRRKSDNGYIIVGANAVARVLAAALERAGHEVVIIDSNAREARVAQEAGFQVIYGSASDDRLLTRADLEGRRGFVALTPNPDANLLMAHHVHELTRLPTTYVALARGKSGARARRVLRDGHHVVFGRAVEMGQWNHHLEQGTARVERWRFDGPKTTDATDEVQGAELGGGTHLVPLTATHGGRTEPVHNATEVRPGDEVVFLLAGEEAGKADDLLRVAGWSFVGGATREVPTHLSTSGTSATSGTSGSAGAAASGTGSA